MSVNFTRVDVLSALAAKRITKAEASAMLRTIVVLEKLAAK